MAWLIVIQPDLLNRSMSDSGPSGFARGPKAAGQRCAWWTCDDGRGWRVHAEWVETCDWGQGKHTTTVPSERVRPAG
jgi:hypothetical protein